MKYNRAMKKIILTGLVTVALAGAAHATLFSYNFDSGLNNGGVIPDGNTSGWSDTRTINNIFNPPPDGEHNDTIVDVNVRLNISGGYNGDLYGYLVHSSGFVVLLNRVGVAASAPASSFGYSDTGFNVTLDSSAANDVHFYGRNGPAFNGSGQLTGSWQPDGRNIDPASSPATFDSASRGSLDSFNTVGANGTWTLFLADLAGGDTSTLVSWGLDISVVPEPATWALLGFASAASLTAGVRWLRRRRS